MQLDKSGRPRLLDNRLLYCDNVLPVQVDETIVALIDPDFIFLKPLTTWMDPKEIVVRGDGLSIEGLKLENGAWVRKGHPAGERQYTA